MVAAGSAARPARACTRIIGEALDAGWTLAVASTSAEPSVRAVLEHVAGAERRRARSPRCSPGRRAGARSPRPTSTCSPLGAPGRATRSEALVVEDSRNGLQAATGRRAALRGHRQRLHRGRGLLRGARWSSARSATPAASAPGCSPTATRAAPGRLGDAARPRGLPRGLTATVRGGRCGWHRRASTGSSWWCARSRRPPSTTRSTSASWTRSSATATSATRWPAASRSCSPTGTASTAPTRRRSCGRSRSSSPAASAGPPGPIWGTAFLRAGGAMNGAEAIGARRARRGAAGGDRGHQAARPVRRGRQDPARRAGPRDRHAGGAPRGRRRRPDRPRPRRRDGPRVGRGDHAHARQAGTRLLHGRAQHREPRRRRHGRRGHVRTARAGLARVAEPRARLITARARVAP